MPSARSRMALAGGLWVLLSQVVMVATGLATVVYLTRTLQPEGYGWYVLALTAVTWTGCFLANGFGMTTAKLVSDPGAGHGWQPVATKVLQVTLGVGLTAMLLLWLLAGALAEALGSAELAGAIRLAAVDLPLFLLAQAYLHVLVGRGLYRRRAFASALRWLFRLALVVAFVELGFGIRGAILGGIGASVIELAACRRFLRVPFFARSEVPVSRLWGYALPLAAAALSLQLLEGLDLFALKLLGASAEAAGLYASALTLSLMPLAVAGAVIPVVMASVNHCLARSDHEGAAGVVRQLSRGLLLVLPLAGVVAATGEEVVVLFLGPSYAGAGPLLAVLFLAALLRLALSTGIALLAVAGRPRSSVPLTAPIVPACLLGYLLFIPRFGAIGAAGVTAGVTLAAAATAFVLVARTYRAGVPLGTLCRSLLATALLVTVLPRWQTAGALALLELMVGCLGAVGLLFVLGELRAGELRRLVATVAGPRSPQPAPTGVEERALP